jgi:hypothetical protein
MLNAATGNPTDPSFRNVLPHRTATQPPFSLDLLSVKSCHAPGSAPWARVGAHSLQDTAIADLDRLLRKAVAAHPSSPVGARNRAALVVRYCCSRRFVVPAAARRNSTSAPSMSPACSSRWARTECSRW